MSNIPSISVEMDKGGAPPAFDGAGDSLIHTRIRQKMKEIISDHQSIAFLDPTAQKLLQEAREYFQVANLGNIYLLDAGGSVFLLTWQGDMVNNTLALMLGSLDLNATNEGVGVFVKNARPREVLTAIKKLVSQGLVEPSQLLSEVKNLEQEKWDWSLPRAVLEKSFSSVSLEQKQALDLLETVLEVESSRNADE